MTVFIAHADADAPAANALAKALERRGNFVEHERAEQIGRPLLAQDAFVLLWSHAMLVDPGRLVLERRALDAWADARLALVLLDQTILPVGMRDLPVIDARVEHARPSVWEDVGARVRALLQEGPPAPSAARASAATRAPGSPARPRFRPQGRARRTGSRFARAGLAIASPLVAGVCLWALTGRAPFAFLPRATTLVILAASVVVGFGALGMLARSFVRRGAQHAPAKPGAGRRAGTARAPAALQEKSPAPTSAHGAPRPPSEAGQSAAAGERGPADLVGAGLKGPSSGPSSAIFVSYAPADASNVDPLVEAVKQEGREVWTDQGARQSEGDRAGQIRRAITGAQGVLVMCSPRAFESDHVKREVYLADRYKKPIVPVFLEPAVLPEDFAYFFAGVQSLELHQTPEAERAAAIGKAVAGV